MKSYKEKLNDIKAFVFDVDGVLTDGSLILMPDGNLTRVMNAKDGYVMKTALEKGFIVAIITGGNDPMVKERLKGLGITDIYTASHNKIEDYEDLLYKYDLKEEEIIYMGDDNPDIPVLERVGLSTCPSNAVADVRQMVEYISPVEGGRGCVREIIEQTMKAQGKWDMSSAKIHTSS